MKKRANFDSHSTKRVSYILATRNRAGFLEKKLKSARKLIKPNDELIIVDGHSTDRTLDVVKKFSDLVDIFISEPDNGPAHANNKGMLQARGKYIKEFPDDDEIYPEALEKTIKVMERHPEVDLLVCGGTKQHGNKFSVVYLEPGVNYGKSVEDVFKYGACGVGFIIRRKSLAKGGLYPTDMISDNHFVLKYISRGLNVKFCRINLFNHPIYPHSAIIAKKKEHERDYYSSLKTYVPLRIYYQYRLQRKIKAEFWRLVEIMYQKFPFLVTLLLPARVLYKLIFVFQAKQNQNPVFTSIEQVNRYKKFKWDGGFS